MSRDRDNWCFPYRPCCGNTQSMPPCQWPGHGPRDDPSLRLKLFGGCGCNGRGAVSVAPPVTIANPWNCRERATVSLAVDECGNLVVSVRRDNC